MLIICDDCPPPATREMHAEWSSFLLEHYGFTDSSATLLRVLAHYCPTAGTWSLYDEG